MRSGPVARREALVTSLPRASERENEGRLVPGLIVRVGSKDSFICFRESVIIWTTGLGAVVLKLVVISSSWEAKEGDDIFASICFLVIDGID